MESINIGNPIIFGLIAGIVTYLINYLDVNYENKKININKDEKCICPKLKLSIKLPLIIGSIVWAASNYFETVTPDESFINNSISAFEQELFTDQPNF